MFTITFCKRREINLLVIEDVASRIRFELLEEDVDENVLERLKTIWKTKLDNLNDTEPDPAVVKDTNKTLISGNSIPTQKPSSPSRKQMIHHNRKAEIAHPMVLPDSDSFDNDLSDIDLSDDDPSDDDLPDDDSSDSDSDSSYDDSFGDSDSSDNEDAQPLISAEDSDEETDNVIVCHCAKSNASLDTLILYLKNGTADLDGEDYVFKKAHGAGK